VAVQVGEEARRSDHSRIAELSGCEERILVFAAFRPWMPKRDCHSNSPGWRAPQPMRNRYGCVPLDSGQPAVSNAETTKMSVIAGADFPAPLRALIFGVPPRLKRSVRPTTATCASTPITELPM
jgi:hypothetical protein